jgi:glycosyl transferase family 25
MEIHPLVDAVYVLSVRSFDDRIAHMQREMAHHGIAFEFVFEFDPDAIPDEVLRRVFGDSPMKLPHKSLVLKHIETWRRCVERGQRRVLVFEDDAILSPNFAPTFARACAEADRLGGAYMVYLGCGDNRYAAAPPGDGCLVAAGPLPAADALLFNQEAARRRLAWLESHRAGLTADWLLRQIDAQQGIVHYWLRDPIVFQGSMDGTFASALDDKRRARGRGYAWLRFRWNRLRFRFLGGRRVREPGR